MQGMINPYSQALRSPQEDEMERQLRMLREASGQAGVTPQQIAAASQGAEGRYEDRLYSRANQDITGLEGDYKRQMAMADSLRGTAMPSGRTVGPSGIFVQNPYEQAAAGIKRLTGGYLGRQAEEGVGSTLEESRLEKARAQAQLERRERDQAREQQRLNNALALRSQDTQEQRAGYEGERIRQSAEQFEAEQKASQDRLERELGTKRTTYIDPETLETLLATGDEDVDDSLITIDDYESLVKAGAIKSSDDEYLAGFDTRTRDAVAKLGSASERKEAAELLTSIAGLNKATEMADSALKQGLSWTGGGDIGVGFATDMFGEETRPAVRNYLRGLIRNDEELNVKASITEAYEKLRRAATGANLTGVEIAFSSDYDPSTPGISEDQAIERLQLVLERVNDSLESRGLPRQPVYSIKQAEESPEDEFELLFNSAGAM